LLRPGNLHVSRGLDACSRNLHATWDAIPASLTVSHVSTLLTKAKAVPATTGSVEDWPKSWASETLKQAQTAFVRDQVQQQAGQETWTATVPANYGTASRPIKETQLTRAGARFAQLLTTIWP
jgi:hypothetical protein